jgi:hypothetical protein
MTDNSFGDAPKRSLRAQKIAAGVEAFVRDVVIPYETDPRRDRHGPTDALVDELRCESACNIDPVQGGSAFKIDPLN